LFTESLQREKKRFKNFFILLENMNKNIKRKEVLRKIELSDLESEAIKGDEMLVTRECPDSRLNSTYHGYAQRMLEGNLFLEDYALFPAVIVLDPFVYEDDKIPHPELLLESMRKLPDRRAIIQLLSVEDNSKWNFYRITTIRENH